VYLIGTLIRVASNLVGRRSCCAPGPGKHLWQGPSGKTPVVDLSSSSDEEDLIPDTSHDFEFAQRLYGELNCAFLISPGNGKIIILSNSGEEKEEVREEKSTGVREAVPSAVVNPASTASVDDANAPVGVKNDNSDDQGPDQEASSEDGGRDDADEP
jgi:hypothetical protein